ncbi:MAG: HAD-IC family P-type ATPase [Bacteroidetes bacterium]|nr:MAG: HAD-IC family P-type ATPase [Bacteroidota bacterium]
MEKTSSTSQAVGVCYHCGDSVRGDRVDHDGKVFCCSGCKVVYDILNRNDLCQYYAIDKTPGNQPAPVETMRFDYLNDEGVQKKLLNFMDGRTASVTLSLPSIHCSSCIWLLEHLYRLDAGVTSSRVDFLKKTISVSYDMRVTSLRAVVMLLSSLGYEPDLRLDSMERREVSDVTRSLYYKIGIAGFCFGNSMLFSFPEYLGVDASEQLLREVFSYLNLLLGIPVATYCSLEYYRSAWGGLRKRVINIDLPIAIGIVLLFGRSAAEILTGSGAGFIDSLCGLLFFLLLGRVFQSKTYDRMNFERSYTSYFPIAVTTKRGGVETTVPLSALSRGQRIVVRSNEIVPADAMLLQGNAFIDYSFVTGEAAPVPKVLGEMIYAGGRQTGGAIELEVMKEVSQSYLTQLWNDFRGGRKGEGNLSELSNTVSKYFTAAVLTLAAAVGLYWLPTDVATALNAFTGILIVACPCALAISIPFTLGTALRIFGRNGFYVKNTGVIERMAKIGTVVFDKTGTLTYPQGSSVSFHGGNLSEREMHAVRSVARNSIHPLSAVIAAGLTSEALRVDGFVEETGRGVAGTAGGLSVRIGSAEFAGSVAGAERIPNESRVYCSVDGELRGFFAVRHGYRAETASVVERLRHRYRFGILSGDTAAERPYLESLFPAGTEMRFAQLPQDKRNAVGSMQAEGRRVLMVGDGLNDAGALLHSDVGIAVSEDVAQFSPSSDAILAGAAFGRLPDLLAFARTSIRVVIASFVFAFLYNTVGLYFAVQGELSPVMAAILMPASSITIVIIATAATRIAARRKGLL